MKVLRQQFANVSLFPALFELTKVLLLNIEELQTQNPYSDNYIESSETMSTTINKLELVVRAETAFGNTVNKLKNRFRLLHYEISRSRIFGMASFSSTWAVHTA